MIKLQQFNVLAFTYDRLKNSKFNINITPLEAQQNEELIALADSEVLRAIRRVTKHPFDRFMLDYYLLEKKKITKLKNSTVNRNRIAEINNFIMRQLFIPDYISITTSKKVSYKKIGRDGFYVNGVHFVRLLCGASQARTNRSIFVSSAIHNELNEILQCGCNMDIEIIAAKYSAYFALTASSSIRVSTPRVCVVPDKEIQMTKTVDWVDESENGKQDIITRQEKELNFNLWDGMGLISPEFAEKWSNELELGYNTSAFCIRSVWVKGMCCVFDFHKFSKEIAHKNIVKDLYGNEVNIDNIDIIISQSQFKMWSAYKSWQDYEEKLIKSGINWGITKIAPKEDDEKHFCRSNYQFLQVLNLNNDDLFELCQPTIDLMNGVMGGSLENMELYLLGKNAKKEDLQDKWDNIRDNFTKALLLAPELIEDNYIYNRIVDSLNKRIRQTYIGKILMQSNFQVLISDPYGYCQHIFGMEITGLLKDREFYSNYWNRKGVSEVIAQRSPLTWRSEVNLLPLVKNEQTEYWYKYIKSGIIFNVWGVDCLLAGGADFDFDILYTTDNPMMIKGRYK